MSAPTRPPRLRRKKPESAPEPADNSAASAIVRTQRAIETLRLLQSGQSWSAVELAERFCCSSRTIFRDMQLLRDCGIPVESPKGGRGFNLAHDFFWHPERPTTDELIALVVGARLAVDSLPNDLARQMERAVSKLLGAAQPVMRQRLNDLTFRIDAPHHAICPQLPEASFLRLLLQRIVEQVPVRLWVRENGAKAKATVMVPVGLNVIDGQWHVIGTLPEGGANLSIPLAAIEKVKPAAAASTADNEPAAADPVPAATDILRIEQE